MDLSTINAVTFEEVLRDYTGLLGHLAVKRSAVILNSDGSARHMIIDMAAWEMFDKAFRAVVSDEGQLMADSPAGHEDLFINVGNFIYDHIPAVLGLEAAQEVLSKRQ